MKRSEIPFFGRLFREEGPTPASAPTGVAEKFNSNMDSLIARYDVLIEEAKAGNEAALKKLRDAGVKI